MNRPARQRARLLEKIASKESRPNHTSGKRTKAWRKWVEHYKAAAEGTVVPAGAAHDAPATA